MRPMIRLSISNARLFRLLLRLYRTKVFLHFEKGAHGMDEVLPRHSISRFARRLVLLIRPT
jgi:hypothetical protein